MSDNPRAIAARLNEAFRRHCGLSGYRHEANRQEDEACMQDALEEMGMLQSPVTINPALAETGRRIAELMRRTGGVCSRCAEGVAWDESSGCCDPACPVQVVAREIAGESGR